MTPEAAIRAALDRRRPDATICPTDAARLLGADWRAHLPAVHAAARRLAAAGAVELRQQGLPCTEPRGAYRIGRPAGGSATPQP